MTTRDDRPDMRHSLDYSQVRPHRSLGEWIRAWKIVMRDPDKPMPDAGIGPEGQPIPSELGIRCPECKERLAGATEWACPACGERFNPLRLYTLRMLQEPEYFLRYRLDPSEIRQGLWAIVLVVVGLIVALVATVITFKRGQTGPVPIATAWRAMSVITFLAVPITIVLHFLQDISWPRIAFFFSIPWLLMCLAVLVLAFL